MSNVLFKKITCFTLSQPTSKANEKEIKLYKHLVILKFLHFTLSFILSIPIFLMITLSASSGNYFFLYKVLFLLGIICTTSPSWGYLLCTYNYNKGNIKTSSRMLHAICIFVVGYILYVSSLFFLA